MGLPRFRVRLRRGALLRAPGVTLRVALGRDSSDLPLPEAGFEADAEPMAVPAVGMESLGKDPVDVAEPLEETVTVFERTVTGQAARVAEIATPSEVPAIAAAEAPSGPPLAEIPRPSSGHLSQELARPELAREIAIDDTSGKDGSSDRTLAAEPTQPTAPAAEAAVESLPPLPEGHHSDEVEEPGRWSTLSVVALTFAVTFAATAGLFALLVGRPGTPSNADERRARLEAQEVRRELELEEQRLAGLAQAVVEDDTRVAASWTRLGVEARALADEHDRSLAAARALGDRLDVLVSRTAELASTSSTVPSTLRPEVRRLENEARAYRTILDRVMTEIEAQRRIALDHAESADTRAHQRELLGVVVRVIHDQERTADARRLVALLEGAGAEAHLFPTRLDDPSPHKGRLYYRGPEDQKAARRIARLAEAIEPIDPEPVGRSNPFLSLWVVGLPPIPEPAEEDRFEEDVFEEDRFEIDPTLDELVSPEEASRQRDDDTSL